MSGDIDGQYRKEKRNKWEKIFNEKYLLNLKNKYSVSNVSNNGYLIDGKYKFYPKSQSIYFIDKKTWLKKYGLKWIKENIL